MADKEPKKGTFKLFEDLVRHLNPSGLWQYSVLAQCCLTMTLIAMLNAEESYLLAGKMDYKCAEDTEFNMTSALEPGVKRDHCYRLDGVTPCEKWTYSSPYFKSTMMSEWDLVCHKAVFVPMYKSLSIVGFFFGLAVWGTIGDRYGRYPLIAVLIPIKLATFWAKIYAPGYWVALSMRVVNGFLGGGYYKAIFVLSECVFCSFDMR